MLVFPKAQGKYKMNFKNKDFFTFSVVRDELRNVSFDVELDFDLNGKK